PKQLGGPHLGLARERRQRHALGLHRVAHHEVELGAVAGGDRHGLADLGVTDELVQEARSAPLGQRQALTQGNRRGLVGYTEGEELGAHGCFSGGSASAWSSRSMRAIFDAMITT